MCYQLFVSRYMQLEGPWQLLNNGGGGLLHDLPQSSPRPALSAVIHGLPCCDSGAPSLPVLSIVRRFDPGKTSLAKKSPQSCGIHVLSLR